MTLFIWQLHILKCDGRLFQVVLAARRFLDIIAQEFADNQKVIT
jgi:hypothetical protein